jgi:hypothetical protein
MTGSSDLYTVNLSVLLASSNKWNPRPVIQSYSAYSSALATMNQEHLLDDLRAPDNIFMTIQTIDRRIPSMDDGISLLTILKHYDLKGEYGGFLLLARTKNIVPFVLQNKLLSSSSYRFDQIIDLSQFDSPLFVKFHFKKSLFGKVVELLFKTTPLLINVELENGDLNFYRIVPCMSESGFILSPFIKDTEDFRKLAESPASLSHNKVRSISIMHATAIAPKFPLSQIVHKFWDDQFTLDIYAMD